MQAIKICSNLHSFSHRWTGIRDDLCLLIDEDMTSVNLCALHCEMRNTEQLLVNLGLAAYDCGSLDACNDILSVYGPENFKGSRITVKPKPNQQTRITRSNVHVSSFSGKCWLCCFNCILLNIYINYNLLSVIEVNRQCGKSHMQTLKCDVGWKKTPACCAQDLRFPNLCTKSRTDNIIMLLVLLGTSLLICTLHHLGYLFETNLN